MNRYDEIKCKARDIASHIHVDPEARDAMATQLIELIGLMFGAVGKSVAIEGESSMIDADSKADSRKAHNRYMIGEHIQDAARELVPEVIDTDVERYSRPNGTEWCVCGHHPDSHKPGGCIGVTHNKHECTGGPCTKFRVKLREPAWKHVDRRPLMMRHMDERGALYLPPALADAQREYDTKVNAAAGERFRELADIQREVADALSTNSTFPPELVAPEMLVPMSEGRWITATGAPCVCVPAPITDGTGRVVGFDPHPGRCTWQQDEQRPSPAAERCNCCAGPCVNGAHVAGPERCCYPLGSVCPVHC